MVISVGIKLHNNKKINESIIYLAPRNKRYVAQRSKNKYNLRKSNFNPYKSVFQILTQEKK